MESLEKIRSKLNVPKSNYNAYGKYKYRSCEDILEAVKPLLKEVGATLIVSDDIVLIGDRYYVKATAKFSKGEKTVESYGFAREPLTKKGMDESQITGAASSYARKYSLNGLFLIDDTKDTDTMPSPDGKPVEEFKQPTEKPMTDKEISDAVDNLDLGDAPSKDSDERDRLLKKIYDAGNKKNYSPGTVRTSIEKKFNKDILMVTLEELNKYSEMFKKVKAK